MRFAWLGPALWLCIGVLAGGERLALAQEPQPSQPQAPLAQEPIRLTLDKSVDIALRNATSVIKNENELKLAGELVLQRYGQFLPNLNAQADYAYSDGRTLLTISGISILNTSGQNADLNLYSTLNLFNGLSDYAGLKATLARREASLLTLVWAKQQVTLDVTQSYLQVVLDEQLLEIARSNLAASEGRLKLLQGQTEVGAATIADLYRQRAQTSSDSLSVTTLENRLRSDQLLLLRKLRLEPSKAYVFEAPSLEPAPSDMAALPVEGLVQDALARRSDLKATGLGVEALDWNVTQARSGYFPRLNLVLARTAVGRLLSDQRLNGQDVLPGSQQSLITQLGNQVTYSVTLNLVWNIFDRFVTRSNVAQAQRTLENSRVDLTDNRLQVETDVRIAHFNYQNAIRQLATAKVGLEAAQKAYELISGRYRVGASTFIDVLTAQATLAQARSNLVQTQINLKLQEKTLDYALGKLL